MIPRIIHYIWLGGAEQPELVRRCIASWHKYMPESEGWQYMEWTEQTINDYSAQASCLSPFTTSPYCQQAYASGKYAFASDYIRLWALEQLGGIYMDVDFEVYKSFTPLLDYPAFAGYEGSKRIPVMMGVLASEPHNPWVQQMLHSYDERPFLRPDGSFDLTPNTGYFTDRLEEQGFVCDGAEKDWKPTDGTSVWFHVFPVDYFCPGLTTGENIRSENTYCEHKGLHSWSGNAGWKEKVLSLVGMDTKIKLIKLKRKILG